MIESGVLVGYDGSAESSSALRWAALEARTRRLPLTVCHVWQWPFEMEPSGPAAIKTAGLMGEHAAKSGAIIASGIVPELVVRPLAIRGLPAEVLVRESRSAGMLVIGHRGTEGFEGLLIGSVAAQLAAHAECPVVIVRGEINGRTEPVLAGIDGSPQSAAVLGFAFEAAALRRMPLRVISSWADPGVIPPDLAALDVERLRNEAAARFERTVAPWCEKYPYVDVHTSFVADPPRRALLTAANEAGLLVVGRRGHGEVYGLPGSVSQYMLHHAPCPVAIVH